MFPLIFLLELHVLSFFDRWFEPFQLIFLLDGHNDQTLFKTICTCSRTCCKIWLDNVLLLNIFSSE